jgi:hypothetical protein
MYKGDMSDIIGTERKNREAAIPASCRIPATPLL